MKKKRHSKEDGGRLNGSREKVAPVPAARRRRKKVEEEKPCGREEKKALGARDF